MAREAETGRTIMGYLTDLWTEAAVARLEDTPRATGPRRSNTASSASGHIPTERTLTERTLMDDSRTIIIARHGNRQDFVDRSWGATAPLPDDPPLSEDGLVQARELGERLKAERVQYIFASHFLRTIQTAHAVAEILDLPLRIEHGLAEWHNAAWFARAPRLTPGSEILARFPRIDAAYRSMVTPRYPETEADLRDRVARAARMLVERWPGNLLFVGHGASVDAASHALAGEGWVVRSSLCSITKLVGADGSWRVVLNGDTAHLSSPRDDP